MPSSLNAAAQRSSVGVSNRIAGASCRGEPAVAGHLFFQLPRTPAGIAERDQPARRPPPLGDGAKDVDRPVQSGVPIQPGRGGSNPAHPNRHCGARTRGPARPARHGGSRHRERSPGSTPSCSRSARKRRPARLWPRGCGPRHPRHGRRSAITAPVEAGIGHAGHRKKQLAGQKRVLGHRPGDAPARQASTSLDGA